MIHDDKNENSDRKQRRERELMRVVDVIVRHYHPRKILLFGSLATGDVHEWSDVDIVIVMDTKARLIDRIGEVLSLCRPRVAMDFLVYTPEEFDRLARDEQFVQEEIVERGRVLYAA